MTDHLLYALAWIAFGLGHSGLASAGAKALLVPLLGRRYRIVYNCLALASFIAVGAVGAATLGDRPGFSPGNWGKVAMMAVHLSGWGVLLASARYYDLGRLGGFRQLKGDSEDEPLRTDGPHAWVRHPIYAGAYLILWGAAISPLGLETALWGSVYLAIGTALEERRLLKLYGQSYREYRASVPALVPWRGRAL